MCTWINVRSVFTTLVLYNLWFMSFFFSPPHLGVLLFFSFLFFFFHVPSPCTTVFCLVVLTPRPITKTIPAWMNERRSASASARRVGLSIASHQHARIPPRRYPPSSVLPISLLRTSKLCESWKQKKKTWGGRWQGLTSSSFSFPSLPLFHLLYFHHMCVYVFVTWYPAHSFLQKREVLRHATRTQL